MELLIKQTQRSIRHSYITKAAQVEIVYISSKIFTSNNFKPLFLIKAFLLILMFSYITLCIYGEHSNSKKYFVFWLPLVVRSNSQQRKLFSNYQTMPGEAEVVVLLPLALRYTILKIVQHSIFIFIRMLRKSFM